MRRVIALFERQVWVAVAEEFTFETSKQVGKIGVRLEITDQVGFAYRTAAVFLHQSFNKRGADGWALDEILNRLLATLQQCCETWMP